MIKHYLLFLLLLISISSINGAVISIPETVTETGYYVELNDRTLSTELVKMQLGGIDWGHSAPVVTGVDGNRIYFQTKNDLARFCSIISYNSQTMAFSGQFVPYIDGLAVPLTVISTHGTFNPNYRDIGGYLNTNTKTSQIAYVYAHSSNNDFSQTWIENNGVEIYTCGYSSSNPQFIPITLMSNNQITLSYRGGGYSSRWSRMATSLVVFDYVDWEYEAVRVVGTNQELYTPPERGTISIYTEPSVSVYSGNSLLGTTDNGGHLELSLPLGEHTLTFVKTGYWDTFKTLTITGENDELFIPLAPRNAIFNIENNFNDNIYPNSVIDYELVLDPIVNAYAGKLKVSGVTPLKVMFDNREIVRGNDGSYVLGDVQSKKPLVIIYQTPRSWGKNSFNLELEGLDIQGNKYVSTTTINYDVLEYPFILEVPSYFAVGNNNIKITDQSGTNYAILLTLFNSEGAEVESYQYSMTGYGQADFNVIVPDSGSYVLKLTAFGGTVISYFPITLIEPITLISTSVDANEGKTATVRFTISNPSNLVKNYHATIESPIFSEAVTKSFSIAPNEINKSVSMSFTVPKDLEYKNYNLNFKVFETGKEDPIYSGIVTLNIIDGLILPNVPINKNYYFLALAAVLIGATIFIWRGKK